MNPRRILAVLALSATTVGGWLVGHATAAPATTPESVQVQLFNDGWTEGMVNACDQGSAYACDWLATTN